MSLSARLRSMAGGATWSPPPPHVRQPALENYTPTSALVVPSPTADDAYHPDVIDTVTGWNGYRFWMGMTPYYLDGVDTENPCILASADGITWVVPAGLTNPISPYEGGYHSDTDLVLDRDQGLLYCFYRTIGGFASGQKFKTSSDGVHWSPETIIEIADGNEMQQLSPSYVRVSATEWRVWWIDFGERLLYTSSAPGPTGPWSAATACDIEVPGTSTMWHVDVIRHEHMYYTLIYCDAPASQIIGGVSFDGVSWGESTDFLMSPRSPFGGLYRATLQPAAGGFQVWVGGTVGGGHRIGRSFVPMAEFT